MWLSVCMMVNLAQWVVSWINLLHTHTHTHTSWSVQAKLQWSVSREGSSYHPCPTNLLCWRYTLYEVCKVNMAAFTVLAYYVCTQLGTLPILLPHFLSPFPLLIFLSSTASFQPAGWEWSPSLMAGTTGYHLLHHTTGDQSVKVSQCQLCNCTWSAKHMKVSLHLILPHILPFSQLHLHWG